MVLAVTEPTLSGLHDLQRLVELCRQFNLTTGICVNKVDLNPDVAAEIRAHANRQRIPILGTIRYDETTTKAQVRQLAVVEAGDSPAAADIRALWGQVQAAMGGT